MKFIMFSELKLNEITRVSVNIFKILRYGSSFNLEIRASEATFQNPCQLCFEICKRNEKSSQMIHSERQKRKKGPESQLRWTYMSSGHNVISNQLSVWKNTTWDFFQVFNFCNKKQSMIKIVRAARSKFKGDYYEKF